MGGSELNEAGSFNTTLVLVGAGLVAGRIGGGDEKAGDTLFGALLLFWLAVLEQGAGYKVEGHSNALSSM